MKFIKNYTYLNLEIVNIQLRKLKLKIGIFFNIVLCIWSDSRIIIDKLQFRFFSKLVVKIMNLVSRIRL